MLFFFMDRYLSLKCIAKSSYRFVLAYENAERGPDVYVDAGNFFSNF
jgi:hypothetical protein